MRDLKSDGYLKTCGYCGCLIYMKADHDDRWRPYESWKDGACDEGEWVMHQCDGGPRGRDSAVWTLADPLPPSHQSVFSRYRQGRDKDSRRTGGQYT